VALNYMKVVDTGIDNGVMDPAKAVAAADVANVSLSVALIRSSIAFLIGGAILYINLKKLKEYKEEKEGLEHSEEQDSERLEYSKGPKYELRDEKTTPMDMKHYIPLIIYFVSITILVVLRY